MGQLQDRMAEDLRFRNFSPATCRNYLLYARRFAKFYMRSPVDLGRVDGRLVVAARWLREAAGRHQVWFGDGQRLWVVQGPGCPEDFVPLGWKPRAAPADCPKTEV